MQVFPLGRKAWLRLAATLACLTILVAGMIFYMTSMPGQSFSGTLPPLSTAEVVVAGNLRKTTTYLAGNIGERNIIAYPQLQTTAAFIESWFKSLGYEVKSQEYVVQMRKVRNLSAEIPGSTRPDEIVIVGAHYDTVYDCPGADDNTSGIAALLELARLLKDRHPARTVRFVAFVNEELPGSRQNPWAAWFMPGRRTASMKKLLRPYRWKRLVCILTGLEASNILNPWDCSIQIEETLSVLSGISPRAVWCGMRLEYFARLQRFRQKVQPLPNSSAAWDGLTTGRSGKLVTQPSW